MNLHLVRSLTPPTTSQYPCVPFCCAPASSPVSHLFISPCFSSGAPPGSSSLLLLLLLPLLFCQLFSFPSLLSVGEVTGIFFPLASLRRLHRILLFFFVLVSYLCFVFCIDEVFLIFASFFCEACLGLFFSPPNPPPPSSFSSGFVWLRNGHSLSLRFSLVLSFVFSPAFLPLSTPPFLFFSLSSFLLGGRGGCFFFPLQQLSLLQPIVIACQ